MIPSATHFFKDYMREFSQDVHTMIPGEIIAWDAAKNEASIKPFASYRKPSENTPNQKKLDFPAIHNVPLFFPQGLAQTATITWAVQPGDECMILFAEQALDTWQDKAETETDLRHDLTNAVAIVGLFAEPNPLIKRATDNESIIVQRENTFIELFDKKIEIYTDGNIFETADENITTVAGQNISTTAGQNIDETAGLNITITAGKDITIKAAGDMKLTADGKMFLKATEIHFN